MSKIDFSKWPAQVEDTQPEGSRERLIVPYLDDSDEIEEIPFLYTLNGSHGLIAAANLHTLQGEKKAGKSALGLVLLVAALKGRFIGITPTRPDLSLLWIDTEQDKNTLKLKRRAVLNMAGLEKRPDRLKIVTLRGFGSTADALKAVLQAIGENAPDLVFLDGIVDLCEAFNDEEKSRAVVRKLEAAAERYGCAILGVIHTNKTSKTEARGHLGAVLQQKCAEIYQVTKEGGNTAKVFQLPSRYTPVPEFYFNFGPDFTIEDAAGTEDTNAAQKRKALERKFNPLYCDDNGRFDPKLRYLNGDLLQLYMDFHGKGKTTANNAIREALDMGILEKQKDGTRFYYRLAIGGLFDAVEDSD